MIVFPYPTLIYISLLFHFPTSTHPAIFTHFFTLTFISSFLLSFLHSLPLTSPLYSSILHFYLLSLTSPLSLFSQFILCLSLILLGEPHIERLTLDWDVQEKHRPSTTVNEGNPVSIVCEAFVIARGNEFRVL